MLFNRFSKSDVIGGRYCIEMELDETVIHVNAIGMTYRTDFVQEIQ